MTGAGDPTFIDTNVLVYSTVLRAPLHASARQSLDALRASAAELWVSRQILREYLAVLTRPQTFTQPLPIAVLVSDVQRFEKEFRVAEDRSDVTAELLRILDLISVGGRQIHDANIVATMRVYGVRQLLTHNPDDFHRFASLISVTPLIGV